MAPFDDRLANLKLRPSIERLNQEAARSWARANVEVKKLGNHARFYPAFVQFHIEALVKHLEDIDRVFRDILALDGNTITPDFIRTQLMPRISMVIASRKGSITHEIDRHHQRPSDIQRGHHILATEINRLLGRIANHYEIEAIELGKSRNRVLAVKTQLPIAPQPSGLEIESILNNGVSRSKAGLWQGFHENFQNLANEETTQHAPGLPRFITAYFNYEKRPEILHVNGPGWLASTLFGKGVAIGGSAGPRFLLMVPSVCSTHLNMDYGWLAKVLVKVCSSVSKPMLPAPQSRSGARQILMRSISGFTVF